jgi:hypothetical protein
MLLGISKRAIQAGETSAAATSVGRVDQMPTQAVYYRAADGFEPVAEFLDDEFPLEPRKKNPSMRELEAAATKRMTIDLQIDRLNGLANDDPPLPFPHTSQIDGPLRELRCHYGRAHYRSSTDGRGTCSSCCT